MQFYYLNIFLSDKRNPSDLEPQFEWPLPAPTGLVYCGGVWVSWEQASIWRSLGGASSQG